MTLLTPLPAQSCCFVDGPGTSCNGDELRWIFARFADNNGLISLGSFLAFMDDRRCSDDEEDR